MVIATLVGTACNVGQSFLLGKVTEQALANRREQVTWLLLAMMTLWLAGPLLQALHSLARLYASQNLRIVVTDHLTARLMHARPICQAWSVRLPTRWSSSCQWLYWRASLWPVCRHPWHC